MIRLTGRYRNQTLELDRPLNIKDGETVIVEVRPLPPASGDDWSEMAIERLEQEWDNPQDAIYDDWRKLYGLPPE